MDKNYDYEMALENVMNIFGVDNGSRDMEDIEETYNEFKDSLEF